METSEDAYMILGPYALLTSMQAHTIIQAYTPEYGTGSGYLSLGHVESYEVLPVRLFVRCTCVRVYIRVCVFTCMRCLSNKPLFRFCFFRCIDPTTESSYRSLFFFFDRNYRV